LTVYDNRRVGGCYHPAVRALALVGLLGYAWAAAAAGTLETAIDNIVAAIPR
jgi:hypothetical protein